MKNNHNNIPPRSEGNEICASGEVWISRDNEIDEEIEQETRQFLGDLQESMERDRIIVGWRPD